MDIPFLDANNPCDSCKKIFFKDPIVLQTPCEIYRLLAQLAIHSLELAAKATHYIDTYWLVRAYWLARQ